MNVCIDCMKEMCMWHDYNGSGDPDAYAVNDSEYCSACGQPPSKDKNGKEI